MLQQTRVEAVIPHYHRFLRLFPSVEALARAAEAEVLAAWSGLGYYSRARNLQRAALRIAAGGFPQTYAQVSELPGIGPYTAAAVASIAMDLPHAAVDGNVLRVVSRLANDSGEISAPATRRRIGEVAQTLLDRKRAGDFNQAMMELGAVVCMPRSPDCGECPVREMCQARLAGTERQLPVKLKKSVVRDVSLNVARITGRGRYKGKFFLVQRAASEKRMAGFWELPAKESLSGWDGEAIGEVSHQIVNDRLRIVVWEGGPPAALPAGRWFAAGELPGIPVTTITRKALAVANATRDTTSP